MEPAPVQTPGMGGIMYKNKKKPVDSTSGNGPIAWLNDISLRERVDRVCKGLKAPRNSGERKYAEAEIKHLISWFSAIVVPVLVIALLLCIPENKGPGAARSAIPFRRFEEKPEPELQKVKEFEIETDEAADLDASMEFISHDIAGPPAHSRRPTGPAQKAVVPELANFHVIKSVVSVPAPLSGRIGKQRRAIIRQHGHAGAEDAVLSGLRWLKRKQNADGSWDSPKAAMTGLALLCFLGHGELPDSPEFGPTVKSAIQWLLDHQTRAGRFKQSDKHEYSLPIAAYALSEAFALTGIPSVRECAERSIQVIIDGQHDSGGWDYNCRHSSRSDTSYMAWCAQALKAARLAKLRNKGLERAAREAVEAFKNNSHPRGGFGYTSAGRSRLTGAGVLSMQLLNAGSSKAAKAGLAFMADERCDWSEPDGKRPLYYWYYITQAFHHAGGKAWKMWDDHFAGEIVSHQIVEETTAGEKTGYWESPSPSENYGPVYSTTLCILMLEVYYRHLHTYTQPAETGPGEISDEDGVEVQVRLPKGFSI